jgi:DmsE family decaheme c-type cytochrome
MNFLQKKMFLYVFIGCFGWVSAASAEGMTEQQNQGASAVAPAPVLAPVLSPVLPDMAPVPAPLSVAAMALNKDAACTRCHDESETKPILAIYQTKHGVKGDPRTPSCQSCHGESEKHLHGDPNQKGRAAPDVLFGSKRGTSGSYAPSDAKVQNEACLSCHYGDTNRTRWAGSAHQASDLACPSCHEIHTAHDKVRDKKTQTEVCFTCHKEQRADSHKISTHPIDVGKVVCSDCHNPHGSAGPKLLKKNTVTETCFMCHAEKRGPFLWEHQPVTEDCTNCHTPHGSNISPLLKSRPPFLCQECHDGPHNSKTPVGPNAAGFQGGLSSTNAIGGALFPSTQAVARGCMNCHAMVHGSNSPAGAYLHR